jgi:hypothetical protein
MATDPTGYISIPYELMRGLSWKIACRVATTASITISTALNNGDTIDGITLVTGDRVLVKNQGTPAQNGIYIVGVTPTRAADMDQDLTTSIPAEEIAGAVVFVISGTANASTIWYTTNAVGGTIGSTSITWTQFTAGGVTGFATPAIVLGTAAAAGAATTVIRSDSTIVAFDATVPTTQAFGDSAATGSAAVAARRDHKHGEPTAAVTTSGLTQATGKLLGRTTASTGAIEEITVGTGLTLATGTLSTSGGTGVGPILISDTPSTPLIFADLIQNEAQDDLVYADI